MTTSIEITIIAASFAGLVAYSIWWLFFSAESITKLIEMEEKQAQAYITVQTTQRLQAKLESMKIQREGLLAELVDNYSTELLRELNILDYHIEVAENRLSGRWLKDEVLTINKSK